jgi:hypothetical protein
VYQTYLDVPAGPRRIEFIENLERETLRQLTQSVQEMSLYFKRLFDTTPVPFGVDRDSHFSRLCEHLVRRAVDRADIEPLDDYYEGEFDTRRVRWYPTSLGTIAQDLRVDAKASTETTRTRLSAQQFPMSAEIELANGTIIRSQRRIAPHTIIRPRLIPSVAGPQRARTAAIAAITTTVFIHLHYATPQQLRSIFLIAAPHQYLKSRYNPSARTNHLWSAGPGPDDARRTRLNFRRLRDNPFSRWRLQHLIYPNPSLMTYTDPVWVDRDRDGNITAIPFDFVAA